MIIIQYVLSTEFWTEKSQNEAVSDADVEVLKVKVSVLRINDLKYSLFTYIHTKELNTLC